MRLIDADATRGELWMAGVNTEVDGVRGVWVRFKEIEKIFDHAPTVDPAKHGRWIEHHEPFTWMGHTTWTCSECGYECGYEKEIGFRTPYCPNCGAKMDKEESDE